MVGKFKPDPTDPVATAAGLARRRRRAAAIEEQHRKEVESQRLADHERRLAEEEADGE